MRLTALASAALPVLGAPATVYSGMPSWAILGLLILPVVLATCHVLVTQVIRLRASSRITRSIDAIRVLEIEDSPPHQCRS